MLGACLLALVVSEAFFDVVLVFGTKTSTTSTYVKQKMDLTQKNEGEKSVFKIGGPICVHSKQ